MKLFFRNFKNLSNIKNCLDCKYSFNQNNTDFKVCTKFPIDFNINNEIKRIYNYAYICRQNNNLCGYEGKYFVERK